MSLLPGSACLSTAAHDDSSPVLMKKQDRSDQLRHCLHWAIASHLFGLIGADRHVHVGDPHRDDSPTTVEGALGCTLEAITSH